jgi:hypothetical protein
MTLSFLGSSFERALLQLLLVIGISSSSSSSSSSSGGKIWSRRGFKKVNFCCFDLQSLDEGCSMGSGSKHSVSVVVTHRRLALSQGILQLLQRTERSLRDAWEGAGGWGGGTSL